MSGVHGHVRELPRRESIRVGAGVGGGGREGVSLAIAGEEGGRRARQVRPNPESSLDRGGCSVTGEERQLRDAGGRRDGACQTDRGSRGSSRKAQGRRRGLDEEGTRSSE